MSTSSHDHAIEQNYATNAPAYSQFASLPLGILEAQLFTLCITNCQGLKVLDLGGGTGNRARDAIAAGAVDIDVIDISPEMMDLGKEIEKSHGRDLIRWHQGDASKGLRHLGLGEGTYDLVIANGVFDHAQTVKELEVMWKNVAMFLKPGGKVIANRNNPKSKAAREVKYGVQLEDFGEFDEGFRYKYRTMTEPVLEFESVALEGYYGVEMVVPGRWFEGFEDVRWEETEVVRRDREFWGEYLEDPILTIFTARKKA